MTSINAYSGGRDRAQSAKRRSVSFQGSFVSAKSEDGCSKGDLNGNIGDEATPLLLGSITSGTGQGSYLSHDVSSMQSARARVRSEFLHSGTASTISSLIVSVVGSVRKLEKSVGCIQGFMLLVGIIIGSGIFLAPNIVVFQVHDFGLALLIWFIAGLLIMMGALCYCELGCAIQKAGGNYAFILFTYGKVPAFLTSWTFALLVDPTIISAVCLTLGTYVLKPFIDNGLISPNPWFSKAIAAVAILTMSITNCLSVKITARLQAIFACCQIISVLFLVVLGIWQLAMGHVKNFHGMLSHVDWDWDLLAPVGMAFYGSLWAYNGWQYVSNVTEDMQNVERNLFLSVVTGVPFIIVCYVAVNVALMTGLTPAEMAASPAVGIEFVQRVLGKKAAYIMPILVALSCYGSANGCIFACGRVSLAAGREGHMPEFLAMIHRKRYTPIPAIMLTTTISLIMLTPDASNLQTLVTFASVSGWVIYTMSIFGVIVLRFRKPDLYRPYKTWIITPIIMTFVGIFLIVIPFVQQPIVSATAIGFILLGLPVYFVFVYMEDKHPKWFLVGCMKLNEFIEDKMGLAKCAV